MKVRDVALFGAAMMAAAPAAAGTLIVTGDTTGSPVFNRPLANGGSAPTGLSGNATATPYDSYDFTVSSTGSYAFNVTSASNSWDNYLVLYSGSFSPTSPLANALIADDDGAGFPNAALSTTLTAGTQYIAVVTGFTNSSFGAYTLTVDGPGNISLGGVVPEPASWALMIGGFGAVGAAARRRRARQTAFA